MVHDPQVLFLGEPLNGTDPRQLLEFHDTMTHLAQEGRTILISSHILEEVDEQAYKVRVVTDSSRKMAPALAGTEEADSVSIGSEGELTVLSRNVNVLQRSILRLAQEHGIQLLRVESLGDSLESIFSYVVDR